MVPLEYGPLPEVLRVMHKVFQVELGEDEIDELRVLARHFDSSIEKMVRLGIQHFLMHEETIKFVKRIPDSNRFYHSKWKGMMESRIGDEIAKKNGVKKDYMNVLNQPILQNASSRLENTSSNNNQQTSSHRITITIDVN